MTNLLILKEKNSQDQKRKTCKIKQIFGSYYALITSLMAMSADNAFGSVESSLQAVQNKLVGTLLPLGAMCGLAVAELSFVAGHPNARQHLFYAVVGAIVGFGAESIVSLIQSLIH